MDSIQLMSVEFRTGAKSAEAESEITE